ncbi:glycine zipper domain-containing protein [Agitococcus lubricus]|uniref:Glycine zipper 2TM protein n=1 Tax=Agitococcus lubricus TaxID=1077255 RepID=A0A2T5J0T5_9GAMM|nr:glycine zipper domain-containing protein [Agitococcus lubricus]PTQ90006.1 glycine zipper 2TM protein [Agitococcus lubricus]
MMKTHILATSLLLGVFTSTSILAADSGSVVGGAVGGAIGAAIGHDMNGRDGAIIGAAIGGATGAAIGSSGQKQTTVVKEHVVVQQPQPVVVQKVVYVKEAKHHRGHGKHKGWYKKHKHHHHDHH